jgi:hypothetical protein
MSGLIGKSWILYFYIQFLKYAVSVKENEKNPVSRKIAGKGRITLSLFM